MYEVGAVLRILVKIIHKIQELAQIFYAAWNRPLSDSPNLFGIGANPILADKATQDRDLRGTEDTFANIRKEFMLTHQLKYLSDMTFVYFDV